MDKWLRNANVVKVVAVLLAILLWVVVHLDLKSSAEVSSPSLRTETINNVSVSAMDNYDTGKYNVVSIDPPEVTVLLKGKDSVIKRLDTSNLKIVVDLSDQQPGVLYLPVRTDRPLPTGVTAEIIPERVKVVLEEKQRKEVPVVIQVTGTPAEGYKAGQPIVNPTRVHVTVSSSMLSSVDSARGEISVEKADSAVQKQVRLTAYDKNGKVIEGGISPQVVDVEVPITIPFKTMPLQIKWIGEPAKGFAVASVQQSVDQLTVYGPQQVLDKMDFYEAFQLDISGIKEDKTWSLDIPLKNNAIQVEPAKVEVKISVVPSVVRTLDNVPLTISGLNDGMAARWVSPETGTLSIRVEGAPNIINKMGLRDVQAIVDVSKLPQGQHELPITFSLPAFVKRADDLMKATVEIGSKQVTGTRQAQETETSAPAFSEKPTSEPTPQPVAAPETKTDSTPGSISEATSAPSASPSVQASPTN